MKHSGSGRMGPFARTGLGTMLAVFVMPAAMIGDSMAGIQSTCTWNVALAESTVVAEWAPPTLEEAGRLLQTEQYKEAADAYRQIVEANPNNAQAAFNYAYATHMAGDLEKALELHKKATEFAQFRPVALYNIGCVYALTGKKDMAFESLQAAMNAGFSDRDQYENDSDLDSLKKDPRWEALFKPEAALKVAEAESVHFESLQASQQMNFLKGEWEISMGDSVVGRSKTRGVLDGRALEETMEITVDAQGSVMRAMSVLSYNESDEKWMWTWVSNMGDHDLMTGSAKGDTMVFTQTKLRDRPGEIGRATFKNAKKDSYQFTWEVSSDEGKTWTLELDIHYKRVF